MSCESLDFSGEPWGLGIFVRWEHGKLAGWVPRGRWEMIKREFQRCNSLVWELYREVCRVRAPQLYFLASHPSPTFVLYLPLYSVSKEGRKGLCCCGGVCRVQFPMTILRVHSCIYEFVHIQISKHIYALVCRPKVWFTWPKKWGFTFSWPWQHSCVIDFPNRIFSVFSRTCKLSIWESRIKHLQ